ncbi:hypothetical protein CLOP_g5484 [Closterium sp. NIES-67]|nr:hypothetical protein CLOP_g5484 [Closterium sp. NIES-67]
MSREARFTSHPRRLAPTPLLVVLALIVFISTAIAASTAVDAPFSIGAQRLWEAGIRSGSRSSGGGIASGGVAPRKGIGASNRLRTSSSTTSSSGGGGTDNGSGRSLRGIRRSNQAHLLSDRAGSGEYGRNVPASFLWPWPVSRVLQQQQHQGIGRSSEVAAPATTGAASALNSTIPQSKVPSQGTSQSKQPSQGTSQSKPSSSSSPPSSPGSPPPSSTLATGSCASPSRAAEWQQLVRRLKPTAVVAKDGTGNYRTVQAAVAAAKEGAVIYVKAGRYEEQVQVAVRRLTLLGDGPSRTILSFNRSQAGHGASLTDSAVLGVQKSGFVAMGIAVENTAGVAGFQAVALLVNADRSAFYQCRFSGYQDTLFAWGKRQYFLNCTIEGSVDFIFGQASAVFDRCRLRVRKGRNQSYIAASGRATANETSGFVFIDSRVESAGATRVALARPWGMCARTVYIRTYLDSCVMNEGWEPWHNRINSRTPYFAELQSYGPGAKPQMRPSWVQPGQISPAAASKFLPNAFIDLSSWVAGTGLPCTSSYKL